MGLSSRMLAVLRNLLRKQDVESRLDDEVRAYVEMATDEKIAAGVAPAEARRRVLAELGGTEPVKQAVRDARAGTIIESVWQDARYGLRQLRRNPAFTGTAILTLGLGIGATTTIFSAVYSLLLRPLPYPDANRLVFIANVWPKRDAAPFPMVNPDFVAAQSSTRSFEQFAGYVDRGDRNLIGAGSPVRLKVMMVTANFFSMLRVSPRPGRNFSSAEDRPKGPGAVLLSYRLWRDKFGGDENIVGRSITLDDEQTTVVGVVPQHFTFPDSAIEPDVYVPAALETDTNLSRDRQLILVNAIARLRPGVTAPQAQAEMQTFFQTRAKGYPASFAGYSDGRVGMMETLQHHLAGDDRKPLLILLVCVMAVLLIACANVANLQMARAVSRQHETAVRGALGAGRLRLARQLLVESLVLSALAAAAGVAIATVVTWLVRLGGAPGAFTGESRVEQLLRTPFGKLSTAIEVDGWVLAFAVGLALLTTMLFGLAPAISGSRTDLRGALQSAALRITAGRHHRLLRHALLVMEVGIAVVLLAGAGLLIRSFANVLHYDSGFDARDTLTAVTQLDRRLPKEEARDFANQLLPPLQALPGVKAAAVASALPLSYTDPCPNSMMFLGDGPLPPSEERKPGCVISVSSDYFHAIGTAMLMGRGFSDDDNAASARVAIVNQAFAKEYFQGDALGKRLNTNIQSKDATHDFSGRTIVGIAQDVRYNGLERDVAPIIYLPMNQVPQWRMNLVLRTANAPSSLPSAVRHAVAGVDPNQPVFDFETMEMRISDAVAQRRFIMLLIACFALLAVLLSAVGVYGVFAYSVSQRRQEMGIRLALGATRGSVLRMVVAHAGRLIALGGVMGAGTALLANKLLASMLVGVSSHDAFTLASALVLMTMVAGVASLLPAAQAARTNLCSVLRTE